jgi:hypothetical protein
LWEQAIAGLADDASRAQVTVAYAWYQVLHDEIPAGVALAADLLGAPRVPDPVRAQARVLLRRRLQASPDAVAEAWDKATKSPVPNWMRLTDEEIQTVVDWVSTGTWSESLAYYESHAVQLQGPGTDAVLDELALRLGGGAAGSSIAVHRAILILSNGTPGTEAAYRCLTDVSEAEYAASSAASRGDWAVLRACGTVEVLVHRRAFLGSVHVVAAEAVQGGQAALRPELLDRLTELAEAVSSKERDRAAADVRAVLSRSAGQGAIGDLLSFL